MTQLYGNLPEDLGFIDIDSKEDWMYKLYMPVKFPSQDCLLSLTEEVKQFFPLILRAYQDFCHLKKWEAEEYYIYLTVKRFYQNSSFCGQRSGLHSDGFMTDDVNYIWYDANPTTFAYNDKLTTFTQDHNVSMKEMEEWCMWKGEGSTDFKRYPEKHLLRLDQSVIHKTTPGFQGLRTFVKISFSKNRYALKGNSYNPLLETSDWDYQDRKEERNCPQGNN
jgi:hypothetical protein